ncbi:MAG: TonB-dependent receptor, partial [Candidatus Udaeobacter sp.]
MNDTASNTRQKALALNLEATTYGTFAEIGAGQEVARWFFSVGGAAGTVAKTISAYDMAVSTGLYGPAQRYVSRQRLEAMLEQEFAQLLERLDNGRGDSKRFFAFADTAATRSYGKPENGRGWLGVRFQAEPRQEPSEIIVHAHLSDYSAAREQEALGILGVNLIHGAFYRRNPVEDL